MLEVLLCCGSSVMAENYRKRHIPDGITGSWEGSVLRVLPPHARGKCLGQQVCHLMCTCAPEEEASEMRAKCCNILTVCQQQLATLWTETDFLAGLINLFMQI